MKYPVYVEVSHKYLDGQCIRFLVESREELGQMYCELAHLEKEIPDFGSAFRFAGYPSVVGNLPTGLIK